jgi:hypothetical protein
MLRGDRFSRTHLSWVVVIPEQLGLKRGREQEV